MAAMSRASKQTCLEDVSPEAWELRTLTLQGDTPVLEHISCGSHSESKSNRTRSYLENVCSKA